jgi:hypothetical protein
VIYEAKKRKKSPFYNVFLQHTRAKIIEPGVRFPISVPRIVIRENILTYFWAQMPSVDDEKSFPNCLKPSA